MSAFDTAVADSKKLTSKPSNDDLLELYGMLFLPIYSPHTLCNPILHTGTRRRWSRSWAQTQAQAPTWSSRKASYQVQPLDRKHLLTPTRPNRTLQSRQRREYCYCSSPRYIRFEGMNRLLFFRSFSSSNPRPPHSPQQFPTYHHSPSFTLSFFKSFAKYSQNRVRPSSAPGKRWWTEVSTPTRQRRHTSSSSRRWRRNTDMMPLRYLRLLVLHKYNTHGCLLSKMESGSEREESAWHGIHKEGDNMDS